MTAQERDFEEILSRVLHTTTDQVEPVGDGLTKIRARLAEPWLKRRWWLLRNELVVLGWLAVVRYESFLATVRAAAVTADATGESAEPLHAGPDAAAAGGTADHSGRLRWLRPVLGPVTAWAAGTPLGKAGAPLRRSVGPAMAWLRPALAVAGAVVLVVAGVFALGPMRGAIIGLENATGIDTSTSSNGGADNGNTNGGGSPVPGSNAGTSAHSQSGQAKAGASSASKATPSPASCSSASPSGNSPSPTPDPTPDPTPTSPSPTPTSPSPTPTSPSPTATATGPVTSAMVAGSRNWSIRTTALVVCVPTPPSSPTNQAPAGA